MLRSVPVFGLVCALLCACAHTGEIPAADGCVTIMAAGDILLDRGVKKKAFVESDPAYPLKHFPRIFRGADLVLANLECALTRGDSAYGKVYLFKAAPRYARLLARAGVAVLSLANNHAYDYGREALLETIGALEQQGIAASGAGRDLEQASRPRFFELKGLRVAVLSFVTMPLEGIVFLPDRPTPALASEELVARRLTEARRQADFVVVSVHWGREFTPRPDPAQLRWATFFREHGADLVVGHHPHVIQTVEQVGGKWVFYSLGNFVFDQPEEPRNLALAARVKVCPRGPVEISAVPVEIVDTRPGVAGPGPAGRILKRLQEISPGLRFTLQGDTILIGM